MYLPIFLYYVKSNHTTPYHIYCHVIGPTRIFPNFQEFFRNLSFGKNSETKQSPPQAPTKNEKTKPWKKTKPAAGAEKF